MNANVVWIRAVPAALACLIFWATSPALSQAHVGNGGHAVVCGAGDKHTFEVLDAHEARILGGPQIALGDPSLEPREKVALALARLSRVDPRMAQGLQNRYQLIFEANSGAQFGTPVEETGDQGMMHVEPECTVLQLAWQWVPIIIEGNELIKVVIDKYLWSKLSNDMKAILLLHETAFSLVLEHTAQQTSERTRAFVRLIASPKIEGFSQDDYEITKRQLGFTWWSVAM